MNQPTTMEPCKHWKASELRKLPPEQRNTLMEAAALQAADDYCYDQTLTGFEAFGKEDLHGDSTNTKAR